MTCQESWSMIEARNELQHCVSMRMPVAELKRVHDLAFARGVDHGRVETLRRADERPTDDVGALLGSLFGGKPK